MAYVACVIDAFSRRIPGWRAATTMTTALVPDALEHAVWTPRRTANWADRPATDTSTVRPPAALSSPAASSVLSGSRPQIARSHPGRAQGGRPADAAADAGNQHGPASHRSAVELSHGRARWSGRWPAPQTVMTILPRVLPASSARMASGTSPSG